MTLIFCLLVLVNCAGGENKSEQSNKKNNQTSSQTSQRSNNSKPPMPNNAVRWDKVVLSTGESICALADSGDLYCWGMNQRSTGIAMDTNETLDALGTGDKSINLFTPKKVIHPHPWKDVAMSEAGFLCGIDTQDYLFCWGANRIFSFGGGGPFFYADGASSKKIIVTRPHKMSDEQFDSLAIGRSTVCAIKKDDGSLWCFGDNFFGFDKSSPSPIKVNDGPFLKPLMTGSKLMAMDSRGHLWESGKALISEKWQKIVANWMPDRVCGINDAHKLLCKGNNQKEILAVQDSSPMVTNFSPIKGGGDFIDISTNARSTCAVKNDNSLWCWGQNTLDIIENGVNKSMQGVLATGSNDSFVTSPQQVMGIKQAKKVVVAGNGSICALTTTQEIYCFGSNTYRDIRGNLRLGVLGINNMKDRVVIQATRVGKEKWDDVFLFDGESEFVACAINDKKSLWCWGGKEFSSIAPNQPIGKVLSSPVLITL